MISIEPKSIKIKIKNNLYDEVVELSEKDLISIFQGYNKNISKKDRKTVENTMKTMSTKFHMDTIVFAEKAEKLSDMVDYDLICGEDEEDIS